MDRILMLRLASLVLLFAIIPLWQQTVRVRNRYFTVMTGLAVLYPLGKVLQCWLIGPGLIRWYMSDVGWISFVALMIAPLMKFRRYLDAANTGVLIAFVLGASVELWQMSVKIDLAHKQSFTAAGDPADLIIFFVMGALNLWLIARMRPPSLIPIEQVQKKRKPLNRPRVLNHR